MSFSKSIVFWQKSIKLKLTLVALLNKCSSKITYLLFPDDLLLTLLFFGAV